MGTDPLRLAASVLLLLCGGCAASQPEYRPTATVRDIMKSMIDPSADGVWESVATTIDADGTHEKVPQTDEEWAAVRQHTITLMEASNLLLMPGRQIARPGEKAEDPKVVLSPEAIEALVNQDRESWTKLAHGLHDAALETLKAVDAKNAQGVFDAGEGIYRACENCHLKYWYPNEAKKEQQ